MGFSKMVSFNNHHVGISCNLPKPFPPESCAHREVLSLHKVLGKQIRDILTAGESLGLGVGGSQADAGRSPFPREANKQSFLYLPKVSNKSLVFMAPQLKRKSSEIFYFFYRKAQGMCLFSRDKMIIPKKSLWIRERSD